MPPVRRPVQPALTPSPTEQREGFIPIDRQRVRIEETGLAGEAFLGEVHLDAHQLGFVTTPPDQSGGFSAEARDCCPNPNSARANRRIFLAALRSRSRTSPQQVSRRSARDSVCRCPQPEPSGDVSAGFTARKRRPAQAAWWAMYAANWVHAAAWMLVARQGVCPIRLTDRSSTAITAKALTSRRLCWWAKSPRRQARRSWIRATTCRRTARSGVPFSRLPKRRWAPARAFSSRRKKRGFSIGSPCVSTANSSRPTSIPTSCPVAGRGDGSARSHEKPTSHLPVLLR